MTSLSYTPPVSQLLSLGDPRGEGHDYLALGLGPDDVPELGRMLLDRDIWGADSELPEFWAPVHAWRAIEEIGSAAGIEPMLALMADMEAFGVDWIFEEIPGVFAAIGPVAVPDLARFLADDEIDTWPRTLGVSCLEEIVRRYPDTRAECTDIVIRQLEQFEGQDKILNAYLIGALIEWKAVQAAPLMEKAFAADAVDIMAVGDWEDVQVEMGLLEERLTPSPDLLAGLPGVAPVRRRSSKQKAKAKKKRKRQKRARRKQRKRK